MNNKSKFTSIKNFYYECKEKKEPAILFLNNLAFVSTTTSLFLNRAGHSSLVVTSSFGIKENDLQVSLHGDIHISENRRFSYKSLFTRIKLILDIGRYSDVIHIHGWSYLPWNLDILYWKICSKKIYFHYHGTDLRGKKELIIPHFICENSFVATPDLLEFASEGTRWLPNPIDLSEINNAVPSFPCTLPFSPSERNALIVLHAPTNRSIKGTQYIIDAIARLKKEGYNIELNLLEGKSHEEVLSSIQGADIVIDQLILGWYGVFAMEAMALGKPVCVYISPSLQRYIPQDAVINVSPKNIYETIKQLVNNTNYLNRVGKNGKEYVYNIHSEKTILAYYHSMYYES